LVARRGQELGVQSELLAFLGGRLHDLIEQESKKASNKRQLLKYSNRLDVCWNFPTETNIKHNLNA